METRFLAAALLLVVAPAFAGDGDRAPLRFRRAPGPLCLRVKERARRLERRVSSDDPVRKRLRVWQAEYLDLPPLALQARRQRRYRLARVLDYAAAEQSFSLSAEALEPMGLEDERIDVSEVPAHSASFDALPEDQKRARAIDGLIAALLPKGAKRPRARWRIAAVEALAFFIPDGARFRGRAAAAFAGIIEDGGRRRARIEVKIRGVLRSPGRFESAEAACKLEGELLWDLAGFPSRLELRGQIDRRVRGQYVNFDSAGKAYYGDRYSRRRCEAVALRYEAEVVDAAKALSDEGRLASPVSPGVDAAPRPRGPVRRPEEKKPAPLSPPCRRAPGKGGAASGPRCSSSAWRR